MTPAAPAPPAGGDATVRAVLDDLLALAARQKRAGWPLTHDKLKAAADLIAGQVAALAAERAEVGRMREVASVKSNVGERLHQLAVERDEARAEVADKAKRISELESECAAREKGADEARDEIRRRVTKDPGYAIAYALLQIADQLEDLGDSVAKIEFAMSVR